MEFNTAAIGQFALWYAAFLLSLTFHEGAHALAAWIGGDDTAYRSGQVSLNPFPHLRREPFGAILVPILSFFSAGWMMGWASTPFDPFWAARHPRRQALMSMAGPAANFVVAGASFLILRLLLSGGVLVLPEQLGFSWVAAPPPGTPGESPLVALAMFLSVVLNLNLLLGMFNLIPLPPLDGAGVAEGLLPARLAAAIGMLRGNPILSILCLLLSWRVFGYVAGPALVTVIRLLHPGAFA